MRRAALAFAFACAACAHAAAPAPAAPAPAASAALADDLAPARFFLGAWSGTNRRADGTTTQITWTVSPGLEGAWLAGAAFARELDVHARDFWGRESDGFVRVYVDSQGTHGTMRSPGWTGATWVWTAEVVTRDGTHLTLRETIERVDDATMHARYEVPRPDGTWLLDSEETLTRAPVTTAPARP